jgi:hypothetical protein
MAQPRSTIPATQATRTQQLIDHLGGPVRVSRLLTQELGYRTSRQAIDNWYRRGHLPFLNHEAYARPMVQAAVETGLAIDLDDILAEVPVPASRLPQ